PKSDLFQMRLGSVAVSSTSACHSGDGNISPVLEALGLSVKEAKSSIRFSFGRGCTEQQLRAGAGTIIKALNHSGKAPFAEDGL
ncbi:MAG: hypothetical protein AB7O96_08185, partial [Pseudobdellovibrionaceae bacterium]